MLFGRHGRQLVNTAMAMGAPLPQRGHPARGLEVICTRKLRIPNLIMGPVAERTVIAVEAPVPAGDGRRNVIKQAFTAEYFNRAFDQPGAPSNWVICAVAATSSIRLIAITGYGQAGDRQRAPDAGFDAHLVKPVEPARPPDMILRLRH